MMPKITTPHLRKNDACPVVALGASAGGLEAFEHFFEATPKDSNIAYILIAHLDPKHKSLLPELIQKKTSIKVQLITDDMVVEPNNAYVIPPDKNVTILNGILKLSSRPKQKKPNLPIDLFFRSLAKDQGNNAIAIILSGTGSDGTLGIRAIKDAGGMVIVQDDTSAMYDGMPKSAIATDLADYILPVEKMPQQIIKFIHHALATSNKSTSPIEAITQVLLQKIYTLIKTQTGHDFSYYKENTICRRIERRMNLHQIADVEEYVNYLQESKLEVNLLFRELLIGVTSFFRNPAAFDALRDKYLPELLYKKVDEDNVRVWVAGCSTGEEAYSLAIILHECMTNIKRYFNIQIFATDLDERAIDIARSGLYPESIVADVSYERLNRYFNKEDDGQYRVKKVIREMLVFAPQNIIKEPPFTKLDLLSCRNLLIYFGSDLQKKIFPIFNYSLKENGILFLGTSETVGHENMLFSVLDKKWKLYKKRAPNKHIVPIIDLPLTSVSVEPMSKNTSPKESQNKELDTLKLVETILKRRNAPPCVIIDENNNVIYIHGRTGHFLEPAQGKINYNILDMARPGIKASLTSGIRKVAEHKQEVTIRNLNVKDNNNSLTIDITITPVLEHSIMRGLVMVTFEEKKPTTSDASAKTSKKKQAKVDEAEITVLEQELRDTKVSLQTTIEELETSNEELKSTNEELQSTNEELQSTNEELETSKEELQSLNEESATVNADLQSRIDELSQTSDDMKNLLDSTNIATLLLDSNLCIRRFTPDMTKIIPLSKSDTGRPLMHFATSLIDTDIAHYAALVMNDLVVREIEVLDNNKDIYLMKVRPYRTLSNVIDGVVITFDNISLHKGVENVLIGSDELYRTLFEQSSAFAILIEIKTENIIHSSPSAYEWLGYSRKSFLAKTIYDITDKETHAYLRKKINLTIKNKMENFKVTFKTKNGDFHDLLVSAQHIIIANSGVVLLLWK